MVKLMIDDLERETYKSDLSSSWKYGIEETLYPLFPIRTTDEGRS